MKDDKIINNMENLRRIREEKNYTQTKVSVDLEVSQELISKYELGTAFPQPNMVIKMARYFNCSTDYILGLTNIKTPIDKLATNIDNLKSAELYNKYSSLSKEDQQYFDRFLDFLYTQSESKK